VRRQDGGWSAPPGVTFADWVAGALPEPPTYADLDYHLSTLFPPVRPQGHLEVRYLDAQPGDGWQVPAAVLWALGGDHAAMDDALAAAEPVADRWQPAARRGLADPDLARAGKGIMLAALGSLARPGVPRAAREAVEGFTERYTLRGRSPADAWLDGGVPRPGRDGWTNGSTTTRRGGRAHPA
jgi:glutamate--cysteine ligase